MKWFKHDSNAHADAKLEKILIRYGAEGYALYWYCLELIAGKVDAENVTFELEHDAELLGHRLKIDTLQVERIMRDMVTLGLFQESRGRITCLKLANRLDERWTRNADLKGVIRATRLTDVSEDGLQASEDSLKTVLSPLPLEEKRREEKRKKEREGDLSVTRAPKGGRFAPPTPEEVRAHCMETGQHIDAERFIDYYTANGWRVGKSPMKSWKAAASGWWRRDQENKPARATGTRARSLADDLTDRSWV